MLVIMTYACNNDLFKKSLKIESRVQKQRFINSFKMPSYTGLINIDDVLNDFPLFRNKFAKNHSNVPAKSDLCLGTGAQVPTISGGLGSGVWIWIWN